MVILNTADPSIHFNQNSLLILNIVLAFILFGIALELRKEDFKSLLTNKRSAVVALLSHFVLLPFVTFAVALVLQPAPGIALGMILVGACPGGNMSNMFTHIAKGNTALAVSITSISHLLAVLFTPLNFAIYGSLYPNSESILKEIHLSVFEVTQTAVIVVAIPLIAGMFIRYKYAELAEKLVPYARKLSLIAFAAFLVVAFYSNRSAIANAASTILPLVVLHNATVLLSGYLFGRIMKLPVKDIRTVTFETGIQNSGLALIIIFSFFAGLYDMAIVAALWGVWHLVSGGALALLWGRVPTEA